MRTVPNASSTEATAAVRWRHAKAILADALELDDVATRTAFVAERCAGDTGLQAEIEHLLAQQADDFDACADFSRDGDPQDGRRLGAYQILREIDRGGMGAVYLAERADGSFEKQVAIKLLKRGTDTDEILRRFRAERRILAGLDHPNIARLLDAGTTDDGLPYFVMEFVEGVPVTEFARARELPMAERLELFLKICAAVELAHHRQVVHRDLKPANILVNAAGEPKLLDFGIAKLLEATEDAMSLTMTRERRLTPICASPEQARGQAVTFASDVYALGALLYELLSGKTPHRFSSNHPDAEEISRVVCEQEPARPSLVTEDRETGRRLRGDLDNIVLMALRKEPARRYGSVTALALDVRMHLGGRAIMARASTPSYIASRFMRRHRNRVAAAATMAVLGVAVGYLLIKSSHQQAVPPPLAPRLARADIPEQATQDHEAYELFLRARALVYQFGTGAKYQEALTSAAELLSEATQRDPNFALAYSLLAEAHLYLYRAFEPTDAHLAAAKEAADTAQRLEPDSGAAHFAQAVFSYDGVRDLHRANTEIAAALQALP
ncbi:MAG: serine/threonine protein kinase, partial [Verrucomicrobiota bacterium]|nr:serine/threonine protein kinase [Verrucomicrobiota bacterium]